MIQTALTFLHRLQRGALFDCLRREVIKLEAGLKATANGALIAGIFGIIYRVSDDVDS